MPEVTLVIRALRFQVFHAGCCWSLSRTDAIALQLNSRFRRQMHALLSACMDLLYNSLSQDPGNLQ